MEQLRENKRAVTSIVVSIVILVWGIVLSFSGFLGGWRALVYACKFLSTASALSFVIQYAIWNWLWRKRPFRWVFRIPDFSGRWEGWYRRTGEPEWHPTAHEITQRALDITATAYGGDNENPGNISEAICASVVTDEHGGSPQLVWTYKTEVLACEPHKGQVHTGTHVLRISIRGNQKHGYGRYFNDRAREDNTIGGGGFFKVKWVSQVHRNGLSFDEQRWGMQKPSPNEENQRQPPINGWGEGTENGECA